MPKINPHINFNGNAEEAFTFYKSVFGGEFSKTLRFGDISMDGYTVSESEGKKLMHIALPIGDNFLIGNDVPEFMGKVNENENRSKISISVESSEEGERIFRGLSESGNVEVAWESGFAMFRDKYGIEWTLSSDANYNTGV